jgi:hypothetical protein
LLPRRFDKWLARCLMRDPRERFADAHAAYSAFDRVDRPDSVAPPAVSPEAVAPPVVARSQVAPLVTAPSAFAPPAISLPAISPTPPAATTSVHAAPPTPRAAKRRGTRVRVLAFVGMSAAFGMWLWNDGSARRAAPAAATLPPASTPTVPSASVPSASIVAPPSAPTPAVPSAVVVALDAGENSAAGDGSDELAGFDIGSAVKSLNRVYYGDCHVPSAGVISIAFNSSGRVKKVALDQGDYDEETTGCLLARFGAATMAPFRGAPQTVTANLVATP